MTRITRHQQRIIALQVLYSLDIRKQLQPENILIELENLKKNEDAVELERGQYFYQIIEGVVESRPQLDKIIEKLAEHDERFDKLDKQSEIVHDNQKKIANVIRIMQKDIDSNKHHIDKIENKDNYFEVREE